MTGTFLASLTLYKQNCNTLDKTIYFTFIFELQSNRSISLLRSTRNTAKIYFIKLYSTRKPILANQKLLEIISNLFERLLISRRRKKDWWSSKQLHEHFIGKRVETLTLAQWKQRDLRTITSNDHRDHYGLNVHSECLIKLHYFYKHYLLGNII